MSQDKYSRTVLWSERLKYFTETQLEYIKKTHVNKHMLIKDSTCSQCVELSLKFFPQEYIMTDSFLRESELGMYSEQLNIIDAAHFNEHIIQEIIRCEQCIPLLQTLILENFQSYDRLSKKTPGRDSRTWKDFFLGNPIEEDIEVYPSIVSYETWQRYGDRDSMCDSTLLYTGSDYDIVTYNKYKKFRIEAQIIWEKIEDETIAKAVVEYTFRSERDKKYSKVILNIPENHTVCPPFIQNNRPHMYGDDTGDPAKRESSARELDDCITKIKATSSSPYGDRTYFVHISYPRTNSHMLTEEEARKLVAYVNSGKYMGAYRPHIK